jgi:hypothetical protein
MYSSRTVMDMVSFVPLACLFSSVKHNVENIINCKLQTHNRDPINYSIGKIKQIQGVKMEKMSPSTMN